MLTHWVANKRGDKPEIKYAKNKFNIVKLTLKNVAKTTINVIMYISYILKNRYLKI